MNEAQLKSDLEVMELFESKTKAELNESSYSQFRDFLASFISDYNSLMSNNQLKPFILKNRALALRARKSLEESQNYLISYCQSIKVIPPERIALLPVPEVSQEKKDFAIDTWNHIASLSPAFTKMEELYNAVRGGYKPAKEVSYRYEEWVDLFNRNAEQLIITLEDPELAEVKQQNQDKIEAAMAVIKSAAFQIEELSRYGIASNTKQNDEKFRKLKERLAI